MSKKIAILSEKDDVFSLQISSFFNKSGINCKIYNLQEFVECITIIHDSTIVKALPECSLLIRPLNGSEILEQEDERFIWNEQFATLWAYGALSKYPVINKPSEWGLSGKACISAELTLKRMGSVEYDRFPEFFWYGLKPTNYENMLHQNIDTWITCEQPNDNAPYRSRFLPKCKGWEQVVVVGDAAFRLTNIELDDKILQQSLDISKLMKLDFITVSWAIGDIDDASILTRINPYPTYHECMPVWTSVCQGLLKLLIK